MTESISVSSNRNRQTSGERRCLNPAFLAIVVEMRMVQVRRSRLFHR